MKRGILCLVTMLLFSVSAIAAENPMASLKPILTDLTDILLDENLQGYEHRIERRAKIMAEVKKGFDFEEMSKRVLGKTWRTLTPDKRAHFVSLMTKLLENIYIGKFEEYEQYAKNYGVKYVGELVKGRRAQVSTHIAGGDKVLPVHYIMHQKNGTWMVYDINLEGMSLIRNYQEQFKSILRKEKYEGLVRTIEEKLASYEKGKP